MEESANAILEVESKSPLRKRSNTKENRSITSSNSPPALGQQVTPPAIATSAADTVVWTQNHSSIGQGVVASFQVEKSKNKRTKNFFGKVVSFAKESKVGANDQLYHIEWEDGDEQDYDGDELAAAIRCYNKYSLVPAVPTTKTKMADEGQSVHLGAPEAPPKYVT